MRAEYEDELKALRIRMENAEHFAVKLPVFADKILERKLSANDDSIDFGGRYKSIPLRWGIRRSYFCPANRRTITNYEGSFEGHLFSIYINSYSLFDCHENFDLYKALSGIPIFFIDTINSTFYLNDSQIEGFLNALDRWYVEAIEKLSKYRAQKRKEDLLKELTTLEKKIGDS